MQLQKISEHLALSKPWKIHQINDQLHKQLTIELACELKKRSLFSRIKDVICPACKQKIQWPATVKYLVIRHINFGDYKVYLRIPNLELNCQQEYASCPMRLYSNPNVPYSLPLEQKIRGFCNVPNGVVVAATSLQLNSNELELLVEYGWLPQTGTIPPSSHPIWRAVITHNIPLKTQNLGLQCLLTWANVQLKRSNLTDGERLIKINMVRSYFEKYHNTLQSELDQLLNAQRSL